jgi:steroid Delta-isomerase
MNQDHAYIHREWHRAASMRDLPALLALYAHDATLESPLVPAVLNEQKRWRASRKSRNCAFP